MHSGSGPSFHGGSKTASVWQVSWLGDHPFSAPSQVFPVASCGVGLPLQLRDSEGVAPSSLLTALATSTAPDR